MLTDEEQADYLDSPSHCPYCGSEEISVVDVNTMNPSTVHQTVVCSGCGNEWEDIYVLAAIKELS